MWAAAPSTVYWVPGEVPHTCTRGHTTQDEPMKEKTDENGGTEGHSQSDSGSSPIHSWPSHCLHYNAFSNHGVPCIVEECGRHQPSQDFLCLDYQVEFWRKCRWMSLRQQPQLRTRVSQHFNVQCSFLCQEGSPTAAKHEKWAKTPNFSHTTRATAWSSCAYFNIFNGR